MMYLLQTQKTYTAITVTVIVLLQINVSCAIRQFYIDENLLPDHIDITETNEDFTDLNDQRSPSTKTLNRSEFSNDDGEELLALAAKAYGLEKQDLSATKPDRQDNFNFYRLKEKREWEHPKIDLSKLFKEAFIQNQETESPIMSRRRSQQLSVSGPLSSLANMLAAEGRRRMHAESFHNRMRLLDLGKRGDDPFSSGSFDNDAISNHVTSENEGFGFK
ncbi:uncharacterized protein LOC127858310 [Dreissena polymorpha]|uniref:Uncharacterized protein n=1 Tax=Dreissena polymorpha TaxID=45954 RepID=A0A9D4BX10_DREPO|nr:uncharacterized protein LOC127858310 [Dreissena polymorpha]KAH3710013.1 hypothetical protein DPMN_069479 [Dreissena polymorpha]